MSKENALRVTRSYTQRLVAPPDEVFPLICPVREAEWLDGWEYKMVYSESGLAEEGCIFTTRHPDPAEPDTVWTITRHDEEAGVVEFVYVTPGWLQAHLRVALEDAPDGDARALAHVTYTYTALSEKGAMEIEHHRSEEAFREMVVWWERSMNHFLETGETLRGQPHA